MSWRKGLWFLAFAAIAVALVAPPAGAAGTRLTPQVFYPTRVDVSPPVRLMPIAHVQHPLRAPFERVQPSQRTLPPGVPVTDPVLQHVAGQLTMPAPLASFEGLGDIDNGNIIGGYLTPADTEGAVGGNSPASNVYIQWVNLVWAVYDKTSGAMTAGPFPGNQIWTGFGGSCEGNNDGDPIVLYDKLADRWFFSQFSVSSSPYAVCFAVSTSPDPLGPYYRYEIDTGGIFPDYPKYSVWADAYYGTVNQFYGASSAGFMALERNKMLTGDPTPALIYFNLNGSPYGNDLPVDFDGALTPPGTGTPGIFTEIDKASWIPGLQSDSLLIWYLTPDWTNPGNSCLGLNCTGDPNEIVPVATFTAPLCGNNRSCIPQMGGESLDAISDRGMYRAVAREFGDHESLLYNHTVDAGGGIAGVRWYELRSSGGFSNWSVYQQGTYAPDDGLYRWMGSIAMDASGDIALGYSTSSSSTYTSVKYTGRLPGDPLGTLGDEGEFVAGSGATNTGYSRWGDYSAMQVDPTDDCTFFFTQMYDDGADDSGPYPGWMWNTRIGSFKFPSCSIGPTGTLQGTVTNANTGDPIPGALVAAGASSTTTNASGFYTFTLPVGTYDMTASRFGYEPGSASGVEVTEGNTTTQDFALNPTGSSWVDGYVTDAGHGWPLYASIAISAAPSFTTTIYTDPFTGYYSIYLPNGYNYTFAVNAVTPNYDPQARPVSVTGTDQSQNFVLAPTSPSCMVPGYGPPTTGFGETFDSVTPPALPGNWQSVEVSDPNNQNPVWTTSAGTVWWGTPAHSAPNDVGSNNYAYYSGEQMRLQTTVSINMTTVAPPQLSYWFYETSGYCSFTAGGTVQPQISTDGGATWTNVGALNNTCNSTAGWVHYTVDLSAYASETNVRIGFLNTSDWWNATNLDDILLGAPGACTPITGGLVGGFVNDGNTGDPLVGAKVANDLGASTLTFATPNDPNIGDGFYSMFTPTPAGNQPPGQRTFTASMTKYASSSATFVVVPSTITRHDFTLDAGWLEMSPTTLTSRLYPGQTEDQMLSLTNMGSADANFKLITSAIQATWPHHSPVKPMSHEKVASTGPARVQHGAVSSTPTQLLLAGVPGFAEDVNNYNFGTWPDVTDPGTFNIISGESSSDFWVGGCFLNGDFSQMYFVTFYGLTLNTVDTTTGAVTAIGPVSPSGGEQITGLTTMPDGTMYAAGSTCSTSTLYTVDPATGATTVVGPITNAPCMISISANADGEIYGVDIVNDNLIKVDPATGAGTIIGSTGVSANYAQGLSFDQDNGVLYWAAYTSNGGEMRVIDTATGASTLVGPLPGGAEFDAFATQTSSGGAGLPWLTLNPTEGTVASGETMPIDALFTADGAPHFGLFRATIKTSSDTPYGTNDVAVNFTKAFNDIPVGYWADVYIHGLAGARVVWGDPGGLFHPSHLVTRDEIAMVLERAYHGADFVPPPAVGIFEDVTPDNPYAAWIEQLFNDGITTGCPYPNYCPTRTMTRAEYSVFLVRAVHGPTFVPPPPVGLFADVSPTYWAAAWIEQLYNDGITTGCAQDPLRFCPEGTVNRAEMATFLVRSFNIPHL